MLSIDTAASTEYDLFGARPVQTPVEIVPTDLDVARPRAKRAAKGSLTAASVDPRVARTFGVRSLFPELISQEASLAKGARLSLFANPSQDGAANSEVAHALTIPDDEDSPAFEAGPAALVTDDQLRAELDAWQPTDQEAALFLWNMQVAHLEENLAFLLSVDTKPRVTREKAHILQWVFTEDVLHGVDFRKNHLSFHACCRAYGFNDPNEFRLKLLQVDLIRKLLVALHLYCEHELPALKHVATYAEIVGEDRAVADNSVYQYAGM